MVACIALTEYATRRRVTQSSDGTLLLPAPVVRGFPEAKDMVVRVSSIKQHEALAQQPPNTPTHLCGVHLHGVFQLGNTAFVPVLGPTNLKDLLRMLQPMSDRGYSQDAGGSGMLPRTYARAASTIPKDTLVGWLTSSPTHELVLCGHSTGGAIATALAYTMLHDLLKKFNRPGDRRLQDILSRFKCVTFGAPLTYDATMAASLPTSEVDVKRVFLHVVQHRDPIVRTSTLQRQALSKLLTVVGKGLKKAATYALTAIAGAVLPVAPPAVAAAAASAATASVGAAAGGGGGDEDGSGATGGASSAAHSAADAAVEEADGELKELGRKLANKHPDNASVFKGISEVLVPDFTPHGHYAFLQPSGKVVHHNAGGSSGRSGRSGRSGHSGRSGRIRRGRGGKKSGKRKAVQARQDLRDRLTFEFAKHMTPVGMQQCTLHSYASALATHLDSLTNDGRSKRQRVPSPKPGSSPPAVWATMRRAGNDTSFWHLDTGCDFEGIATKIDIDAAGAGKPRVVVNLRGAGCDLICPATLRVADNRNCTHLKATREGLEAEVLLEEEVADEAIVGWLPMYPGPTLDGTDPPATEILVRVVPRLHKLTDAQRQQQCSISTLLLGAASQRLCGCRALARTRAQANAAPGSGATDGANMMQKMARGLHQRCGDTWRLAMTAFKALGVHCGPVSLEWRTDLAWQEQVPTPPKPPPDADMDAPNSDFALTIKQMHRMQAVLARLMAAVQGLLSREKMLKLFTKGMKSISLSIPWLKELDPNVESPFAKFLRKWGSSRRDEGAVKALNFALEQLRPARLRLNPANTHSMLLMAGTGVVSRRVERSEDTHAPDTQLPALIDDWDEAARRSERIDTLGAEEQVDLFAAASATSFYAAMVGLTPIRFGDVVFGKMYAFTSTKRLLANAAREVRRGGEQLRHGANAAVRAEGAGRVAGTVFGAAVAVPVLAALAPVFFPFELAGRGIKKMYKRWKAMKLQPEPTDVRYRNWLVWFCTNVLKAEYRDDGSKAYTSPEHLLYTHFGKHLLPMLRRDTELLSTAAVYAVFKDVIRPKIECSGQETPESQLAVVQVLAMAAVMYELRNRLFTGPACTAVFGVQNAGKSTSLREAFRLQDKVGNASPTAHTRVPQLEPVVVPPKYESDGYTLVMDYPAVNDDMPWSAVFHDLLHAPTACVLMLKMEGANTWWKMVKRIACMPEFPKRLLICLNQWDEVFVSQREHEQKARAEAARGTVDRAAWVDSSDEEDDGARVVPLGVGGKTEEGVAPPTAPRGADAAASSELSVEAAATRAVVDSFLSDVKTLWPHVSHLGDSCTLQATCMTKKSSELKAWNDMIWADLRRRGAPVDEHRTVAEEDRDEEVNDMSYWILRHLGLYRSAKPKVSAVPRIEMKVGSANVTRTFVYREAARHFGSRPSVPVRAAWGPTVDCDAPPAAAFPPSPSSSLRSSPGATPATAAVGAPASTTPTSGAHAIAINTSVPNTGLPPGAAELLRDTAPHGQQG